MQDAIPAARLVTQRETFDEEPYCVDFRLLGSDDDCCFFVDGEVLDDLFDVHCCRWGEKPRWEVQVRGIFKHGSRVATLFRPRLGGFGFLPFVGVCSGLLSALFKEGVLEFLFAVADVLVDLFTWKSEEGREVKNVEI